LCACYDKPRLESKAARSPYSALIPEPPSLSFRQIGNRPA
jgi:hypothetical protein